MEGRAGEAACKEQVIANATGLRVLAAVSAAVQTGDPYDVDHRVRRADGVYRWFNARGLALRDAEGRIVRWYVLLTDIDERRRAEEKLHDENVALREEINKASMFEEIVGTSPLLQTVLSRVSKVAPTDCSVLITGETGTGKELVARAIHKRSRRSSRPFVSVNCAAVPRDLIASELFGHEKGAFTGATQRRLGRFELAEGGTIFLDEVGELPAETQIALLRVLQEHEFERVGGTGSIQTNVRVIAATNRDLEDAIAAGLFRSDLFYRLNVFPIEMPPLRERKEDIPLLVGYFVRLLSAKVRHLTARDRRDDCPSEGHGGEPMTRARTALASVPLVTALGLLSLVLGACAFPQSTRPPDTLNPSLFQLQHTSWTEREGAPPAVNDIIQAPDGSLWLGSGEGLYHFDGFTFERVRSIDGGSPAPTEIYCLLAASNGDLWIGTALNGAILVRNGEVKRFPKFEGLPLSTTVLGLAQDLDGTIWASTASGLQRFDGSQWRNIGKAWGVPEMMDFRVQIDSNGTLWAETFEHGLFRLKRGSQHFERLADVSQDEEVRAARFETGHFFDQSPSGEYWASTSSGISPLAEALKSPLRPHWALRNKWSATSHSAAYALLTFDRRGNLWMKSQQSGGIKRLDAAAFRDAFHPGHLERKEESFTKRDGLTSDSIHSVFRDRDGSIWVGTDHGLDHFREPPFLPPLPTPGTYQFGIQAQKDGHVWIGSVEGGLWIASAAGMSRRVPLPEVEVDSLYETRRGTLWFAALPPLTIGSIDDDTKDGKTTSLPLTPELRSQLAVQSIVEDVRGAVWASFIPYGLAKWEGGHWTRNGGLTSLPQAWVVILSTDPQGRIWAGYLNGEVAVIDGTSVRKFSLKDGLNIGPVAAILCGQSDCWLAGVNGLVRFDGQRFHVLSEANNRPFSGITGIAEARNGDLWLNAFDGVRRVAAAELREAETNPAYAVHSDLYDLADGLPSVPQRIRPFPTAVSAPDGRIWLGFRAGVVSVDPKDPSLSSPVPPVSVVRAIADGKTFSASTSIRLTARTKNLEIDYTAVSMNRASRVRFRYKLEGMDAGWQNAGSRRQAFYNNLPPGKYRFVVSASNGDNLWNEAGASMNMEVPPAFSQTTWFRSLCVLAAMLGLWGILRLRIRQTVAKVQAQSRERMLERERIAGDLHDTLLQGYLSASLQAHAAFGRLAEDSPAKQPLRRALELIGKASEESRIALQGIRSSQFGELELGQALSRVPQELDAPAGVGFRVRVEGRARSLRPVLLDDVYRIGREAIVNAFQHAGATNIVVEVEYAANRLRVLVQDNGCGIDAQLLQSGKAGHWGLKGMRERAERIGGKLNLFSNPEAGTQVVLTVAAQLAFEPEEIGKRREWVHRLFRRDSAHSKQAEKEDPDERAGSHQNTQR